MTEHPKLSPDTLQELAEEFAKTLTEARLQKAAVTPDAIDKASLPYNIQMWTTFFYSSYDMFLAELSSQNEQRTPPPD